MPTFSKLTNVQHHYVQISYAEFHPNRTINLEAVDRISFMSLSKYDFHCIEWLLSNITYKFSVPNYI
jgi:hypothetical protein